MNITKIIIEKHRQIQIQDITVSDKNPSSDNQTCTVHKLTIHKSKVKEVTKRKQKDFNQNKSMEKVRK